MFKGSGVLSNRDVHTGFEKVFKGSGVLSKKDVHTGFKNVFKGLGSSPTGMFIQGLRMCSRVWGPVQQGCSYRV